MKFFISFLMALFVWPAAAISEERTYASRFQLDRKLCESLFDPAELGIRFSRKILDRDWEQLRGQLERHGFYRVITSFIPDLDGRMPLATDSNSAVERLVSGFYVIVNRDSILNDEMGLSYENGLIANANMIVIRKGHEAALRFGIGVHPDARRLGLYKHALAEAVFQAARKGVEIGQIPLHALSHHHQESVNFSVFVQALGFPSGRLGKIHPDLLKQWVPPAIQELRSQILASSLQMPAAKGRAALGFSRLMAVKINVETGSLLFDFRRGEALNPEQVRMLITAGRAGTIRPIVELRPDGSVVPLARHSLGLIEEAVDLDQRP